MQATVDIAEGTVLGQRQLNRTLLARQHLLERVDVLPGDLVSRLVGMQSQVPTDPFVGLWTRLRTFSHDDLSRMMLDRDTVRASLMRGTIHLVTRDDYRALFPVTFPLHQRTLPATARGMMLEPDQFRPIIDAGTEALRDTPMTMKQLGGHLEERFPDLPPAAMAQACRFLLPLVQATPRGTWGARHQATWALAEEWLEDHVPYEGDPGDVLKRYLAAFGPATVADMQAWSGLTGLRAAVKEIRDELVTYRNDRGQELFDVPDGLFVDEETPASIRFLPEFDNLLLSHKDRSRIITEERRKAIGSVNGRFSCTYLVDGIVSGTWKIETTTSGATLTLLPFESHSRQAMRDLEAEGDRLLAFVTGADQREVIVESQADV